MASKRARKLLTLEFFKAISNPKRAYDMGPRILELAEQAIELEAEKYRKKHNIKKLND